MAVLTGKTNDTTEAACNARLIAAAPEMLDSLSELAELLPSIVKQLPYGVPMSVAEKHDRALAVLAKAEGGRP